MKKHFTHVALILIAILSLYSHSFADGVYLPETNKKIPNIPVQRALLKYRNGIETLIIESSLNGVQSNYGWIIPIPNLPLKFEKASPGLFKTLSLQLQPRIHYAPPHPELWNDHDIRLATLYTVLVLIGCFIFMRWGAKRSLIPMAVIISFMIWFPNYLTYHQKAYRAEPEFSSRMDPLVKIRDREVVGNYEIFMLEARNSLQLNAWLDNNGLGQFPPKAVKLLEDYIEQGWYFVVAKLRTESNGIATPHPVLLKFESSRPVYPMKLTALSGPKIYLELYVVGNRELVPINYDLDREYGNIFDLKQIPASGTDPAILNSNVYKPREAFNRLTEIAHPDASMVMWNACVLTKLSGSVAGEDMQEDMLFKYKPAVPYQQVLYSPQAILRKAYINTLWVAAISVIILAAFYRILNKRRGKPGMASVWLLQLILCTAGFAYTYLSLDETTDFQVEMKSRPTYYEDPPTLFIYDHPDNEPSSGEEFIAILKWNGIKNPITSEPIILEHSPGNVVWAQSVNENKMKYCRRNGSLTDFSVIRLPFEAPSDIINIDQNFTLTLQPNNIRHQVKEEMMPNIKKLDLH